MSTQNTQNVESKKNAKTKKAEKKAAKAAELARLAALVAEGKPTDSPPAGWDKIEGGQERVDAAQAAGATPAELDDLKAGIEAEASKETEEVAKTEMVPVPRSLPVTGGKRKSRNRSVKEVLTAIAGDATIANVPKELVKDYVSNFLGSIPGMPRSVSRALLGLRRLARAIELGHAPSAALFTMFTIANKKHITKVVKVEEKVAPQADESK